MATTVVMPQMGFDMQEGTIVRWLKAEGDQVSRGEPIAEIETDKAIVEMEAYASGTLLKTVVGEGETVPVGQTIAVIGAPGEPLPDLGAAPSAPAEAEAPQEAPGRAGGGEAGRGACRRRAGEGVAPGPSAGGGERHRPVACQWQRAGRPRHP